MELKYVRVRIREVVIRPLIVPYGIEMKQLILRVLIQHPLNCTLWN